MIVSIITSTKRDKNEKRERDMISFRNTVVAFDLAKIIFFGLMKNAISLCGAKDGFKNLPRSEESWTAMIKMPFLMHIFSHLQDQNVELNSATSFIVVSMSYRFKIKHYGCFVDRSLSLSLWPF